ncbi:hypothetical protein FGSG_04614 [Fusarium graminearum PH-1]|uniref:Chromosome 2, complete genome n=1 Tax=Gibberella zeae (strain ATCC MYA-4620 / CBS 123657 / FGSC 9075 / NRRL 31084 / PH-1) TaxID=229533 RepID=I1RL34_GIBZE|nr:hypothetical protein FGSG_04614 [Fusarium graminearum PH-1]ESU08464.1 hypothetical protein FGSG_04614 [Fusarium graminearum PH-1]CEF79653.1 unnamed protein product [Fusarium graminearum]|eukprot:XP_011320963.1 hypothetical protein FGSG_04614 [Fusarium graminearum PH-1]
MVAVKSISLLFALVTESLVASQNLIFTRKVNVVVIPRPTTTTFTDVKTITETTQADPDVETAIETKADVTTTIEVRLHTTTSISTSSRTITAYTTTSTIQAPAGSTPAKGSDWRPKIKARDSLNTLKERAAVELFPAGLQSNPEYVQRVDCTKKVPSTSIKVTTITVKGTRVTASPKTKTKVITSSTTTELHVKLGPTVVTVCRVALR